MKCCLDLVVVYWMDPQMGQSLNGPFYCLSSELCFCNSFLDHSFAASSSPPFLTPQTSKEAVSIVPVGLQIKGEEYSILLSQ